MCGNSNESGQSDQKQPKNLILCSGGRGVIRTVLRGKATPRGSSTSSGTSFFCDALPSSRDSYTQVQQADRG